MSEDHAIQISCYFNCIEMFYAPQEVTSGENPKRRRGHADDNSPVKFEQQCFKRLDNVYCSRGYSKEAEID